MAFVICVVLTVTGCKGLVGRNAGTMGPAFRAQVSANERVENIGKSEAKNSEARLDHIGAWSEGTKYALDKVPEPSKEVTVAKDINERVQTLANKPDFNEVREVKNIIDGLLSQMTSQQEMAQALLHDKDTEIYKLTLEVKALEVAKESEISKALKTAASSAAKADQYKETLSDMDSFFGLGAIFYGVKKLITRSIWVIVIFLVVFLVLRLAASANPVCAAIFSIFEQVIAWFINALKMIAPKAAQYSGMVTNKVFDGYKLTLTKIIDAIQLLKEKETPVKKATIDELTAELAKSMDVADKERVEGVKKDLHWK